MNPYGHKAMTYYRDHLPAEFAKIANLREHFSSLGEQIQQKIDSRTREIAGPPGADYMANVQNLNMSRLRAQEEILAEMLPGWAATSA